MTIEIKKLFKSRTILYLLIIMLLLSISFSLFVIHGLDSELSIGDKEKIAAEIYFQLIYYCTPLLLVFLADFVFNQDFVMGTIKHLILKSDRNTIYIIKLLSLSLASIVLTALFHASSLLSITWGLGISAADSLLTAVLYESIPVLEMSLLFSLVSLLGKKNNLLYLISLHLIILFLAESSLSPGKYSYVSSFKAAILDSRIPVSSIIGILLLTLATYLLFTHKELTE
ncbi:MAG: hypothetical protein QM296_09845 [Bacillota bacterium]|nr:hypothetical protein [Bacillota bacterium]